MFPYIDLDMLCFQYVCDLISYGVIRTSFCSYVMAGGTTQASQAMA